MTLIPIGKMSKNGDNMDILGFQSGHDVSYCVLRDGKPIIHEELERFIREKEPRGDGLKMAFERLPVSFFKDLKVS